ncbi:MAG: class I tRNA ligase family protein, partial [Bacillota bacterium]|nr:class I tRNA ligase family protein [Bacillota bacterium]
YFNWMENIQDWCISRQLWWGHRIPVWYCKDCGEIIVSMDEPKSCTKCKSTDLEQDKDVLDTWFSSALWPFSTLGWPDETEDLKYFYPTDVLVTGYDIIFFWVARMIFSGIHNMDDIPFDTVLIHGIVRDGEGRKMSKSLGNGVDPLDVIDKYGADALRFMLVTGNAAGSDIRYYEEKVEAARNFANKIWNASRFVMMNLDKSLMEKYKDNKEYSLSDRWILSRLNTLTLEVTENIDKYELGIASQKIYDFIWTEFCDYYIELSKISLYGDNEKEKGITLNVLYRALLGSLKLLHPIMPFITEEIFLHLGTGEESITISKWPEYKEEIHDEKSEFMMNTVMEAIRGIRNIRTEVNAKPSKKVKLFILPKKEGIEAFINGKTYFEKLAYAEEVVIIESKDNLPENVVSVVTTEGEMFISLFDLIDKDKEIERLNKEKERLESEIQRVDKKLSNTGFTSKAPEKVIEEERTKGEKYKEMLDAVLVRIKSME